MSLGLVPAMISYCLEIIWGRAPFGTPRTGASWVLGVIHVAF